MDAPIVSGMYAVLFQGLDPDEGIKMLATREMKSESYGCGFFSESWLKMVVENLASC